MMLMMIMIDGDAIGNTLMLHALLALGCIDGYC